MPCFVEGCTQLDRLPLADGAFDLFAGPESLGDPEVDWDLLDQVGLVRCRELTADGTACQRVEGLAGIAPVVYAKHAIEVGTTYTDISAAEYAAQWSVTGSGPAPTEAVTIRGHAGVRFTYADREQLVWQERDDALAWIALPATMADNAV